MAVKPIPDGYQSVTPYLIVPGVRKLLDFLKQAFDAEQQEFMATDDGIVRHAEARIGGSVVMMGESSEQWPAMPAMLYFYVKDVDATYRRALDAGATSVAEPADQFYGDRNGTVRDPSGNLWCIATRKEDLSPEEVGSRAKAYMQSK